MSGGVWISAEQRHEMPEAEPIPPRWARACRAAGVILTVVLLAPLGGTAGQVPVVAQSNVTVTVMAANLTGDPQRYEIPAIRILQGLKPDVVAIQEFNYAGKTPADIRAFVDLAFGTNFHFYRENGSYAIPNGIISRWPILGCGSWDDPQVPDRGFAWARLDLPGGHDLHVVSLHLHSAGGASSRAIEAGVIRSNVWSSFPTNAWTVLAGDLNTGSRDETALTIFRTFLSDWPIPTDAITDGNDKTNQKRTKPYDYVLASFSLTNRLVPVATGGIDFPDGLVFDSRVFTPLSAVPPIQFDDSTNCQHMAVLKAFGYTYSVTNWLEVPSPEVAVVSNQFLRWSGPANLIYSVQMKTNLTDEAPWTTVAAGSSVTTNYSFTVTNSKPGSRFFRVTCP
jgi:endonuclease/exonuclease/phosphatase family metal-dependent hydrolase